LDRGLFDQEDLSKSTDQEQMDFISLKEENKRLKTAIEEARKEN